MQKQDLDILELQLTNGCLYSLLVKKGIITTDEYFEHSKLLKATMLKAFSGVDEAEELAKIISATYDKIALKAK